MIHCPDILAPTEEDVLSLVYEEGDLSAQAQQHLQQCSICRERLTSYSDLHHALLAQVRRGLCPSAVRLNYYCLDVLNEEERVSIARHLLECPPCADEVTEIRRTLRTFEPFPEPSPTLGRVVRRIFANLVVQQVKLVTRGETSAANWPRQYQAEALDISLHLSRHANGEIMLLGILTSSDPDLTVDAFEGIEAELYAAPGPFKAETTASAYPLLTAQVDEIGNLLLEPVPAGEYVMLIRLPGQEIVIEGLRIIYG